MVFSNNITGSTQGVYMTSFTSPGHMNRGEILKNGLTLYSVRSLIKSNWINSNDVYIGKD